MTHEPLDLVVLAGRLIDPLRDDVLLDQRIVVSGDRVSAVLGPDEPGPARGLRQTLDLSGLTVLPGLIDCHAHLIGELEYSGVPAIHQTADEELAGGIANAAATLRAGFTTVRDVGTFRAFLDIRLRDLIESNARPDVIGPRMQCAAGYITKPRGGGEVTGRPDVVVPPEFRQGVVRTPDDVRVAVRRFAAGGAGVIKVIATGAVLTEGTTIGEIELPPPLLEAAVDEAARHGLFVAAHAHGTDGIKAAIRAGVRSIEHGSLLDDEGVDLLFRHGTWLVADVYDGDWIDEVGRRDDWPAETLRKNAETTDAQRQAFSRCVAAGVRLAFGTDSGVYPHGMNAIQFGYMVRLGMSPLQAIRSATAEAAELMGWSDRVGSLAPGRFADLIAVDGDPAGDIELLRRPVVVMKGGVVIRDERRGATT